MLGRLPVGPRLGAWTKFALTASVAAATMASAAQTGAPPAVPPSEPARARLLELQQEALDRLQGFQQPDTPKDAARRLAIEAAGKIDALVLAAEAGTAGTASLLSEATRVELRQLAVELRKGPEDALGPDGRARALKLLERSGVELGAPPFGLRFEGSYSETRKREPVLGGHSSPTRPPRAAPTTNADRPASPVELALAKASLGVKTYDGGPTKEHILESAGTGVALVDYDNDGRLDIFVVNAFELDAQRRPLPHRNALFRNLGNWRFEDVSKAAGIDAAAWGNGVCAGDYDDDGDLDLYVTNFGSNALYQNGGDGRFANVAAAAGVAAAGWSTGCTFFDADGDQDLDLYVVRYVHTSWAELERAERTLTWRGGPKVMAGPAGLPGEADLFFENRGDGTFMEATDAHGLKDAGQAYGFGVVATDYDDDGWVDLFVANDTNPNFLYRNRGAGRFESAGLVAGVALNADGRAQAGMGVDSGDYDGDGRLDLLVTTFAHDTTTLFRNLDGHQFEDATLSSGLGPPTFEPMGWGAAFVDIDQDGDLDLFLVNGHIYPNVVQFPALKESYRQRNQLLLNEGGRFVDVTDSAGPGLAAENVGRGLAVGDIDDDGDMDFVVSNMDDTPTVIENRPLSGNHWVAFRLDKVGRNRFAIGARVTLAAGGRRQVQEVRSGGSYLSQNDLRPRFGLGTHAGTVDVDVRLPGGRNWRFEGLAPDRLHVLVLDDELSTRKSRP